MEEQNRTQSDMTAENQMEGNIQQKEEESVDTEMIDKWIDRDGEADENIVAIID